MQKFNLMIRKTIMINMEKNNFKINIIYCILNTDEQVFFLFFLTNNFQLSKILNKFYSNFYFVLNKNFYLLLIIINRYY